MVRRSILAQCVAGVLVVSLVCASLASARETTKQILQRIEETLAQIITLVTPLPPPPPVPVNRTRLLFPYVTNWAGFDTGISVANTGRDSSGVIGVAGRCRIYYFGQKANGEPVATSQLTNRDVAVGETITFVLSSGGGLGIAGSPAFQGYIEVDCAFPFAHGYAIVTDGPIGQSRIGNMAPALVLPHNRTRFAAESLGQ
jgi:hypothetical protein